MPTALEIQAARRELERRGAIQELNRRGVQTPTDKALDIDITTGLQDIPLRIRLGFAESDEARLKLLRKQFPDARRLDEDHRLVYTNPATNKLTAVDEQGFTLRDLADWVGYMPEVIGGTIGALAAAPIPVPGARVAGAGIGMGLGRVVKKGIAGLIEEKIPTGDELARAGAESAMYGMGGEAVGGALIKAAGPYAKRILPETREAITRFAKYRGRLSPAQATEARGMDILENIAEYSLVGSEPFRAFRVSQEQALSRWADDIAMQVGNHMTPEQIGQLTSDAINKRSNIFNRAGKILFKRVDDLTKEAQVDTKIPTSIANQMLKVAQRPYAKSLRSKTGERILKDFANLPDKISFAEAQGLRSDLMSMSRQTTELIPGKIIGVSKNLTKAMDEAIQKSVPKGTQAIKAFRDANRFWKTGKELFNSKLAKSLLRNNPEAIGKGIFRPGAISNIKMVKRMVDKETFNKLRGGYLQTIIQPNPQTGVVEGGAILNRLARMGEPTLKEIFDPQHLKDIRAFGEMAKRTQAPPGQGTGRMLVQLTQGGAALTLLSTGFETEAAATIIVPAVLARFMTNRAGIKWLTTGLTMSTGTRESIRLGTRIMALATKEGLRTKPAPQEQVGAFAPQTFPQFAR